MAKLLEGGIAKAIYRAFRGKLLKGTLIRAVAVHGSQDKYGDPTTNPRRFKCQGFIDNADRYFVRDAVPIGDVTVNIFAASLSTQPTADDVVEFTNKRLVRSFKLRRVRTDPATALWVCDAFSLTDAAPPVPNAG